MHWDQKRMLLSNLTENKRRNLNVLPNVKKTIKFDYYVKCLKWGLQEGENDFNENVDNYLIRNRNHGIFSQKLGKPSLNAFDDKQKHTNNIESKPWSWNK